MDDITRKKAFRSRLESLKRENRKLSERLADLKKEKELLRRDLNMTRRLLAEIPGPVILVQDERMVYASKSAWEHLGYSEKEFLRQPLIGLIHPRSVEFANDFMKKLSSGKPVPGPFEIYMRKKNGQPMACEVHWKKIRYQRKIAFLFNVIGLDSRKMLEKETSQSEKFRAITKMAAWLSRDYEQSLVSVREQFSRFRDSRPVVDRALIRALHGVEARLEMGNIISRKLSCLVKTQNDPSDVSTFDLKKIVREAVRISSLDRHEDENAPIKVRTYLRDLSPVEGHCSEIRDAFVSMILNAADAMPEGGEIYVTTEENSGFAWVYIQDGGTGIPEDIQDRIFDPFFSTRGRERAGLGLSLARAIINRNGGKIDVISQEGQGSTFIVNLPLSRRTLSDSTDRHRKNRIRGSHILMISAGSIAEDLLSRVLMKKGGKVTVLYSAPEACKLMRKKQFDLLIAGIDDPDIRPVEIVRMIRRIRSDMPVVLVNAGDRPRPFTRLRESGADLIIERPLHMDRISDHLSELIATWKVVG